MAKKVGSAIAGFSIEISSQKYYAQICPKYGK
jgi:hypothetical protein